MGGAPKSTTPVRRADEISLLREYPYLLSMHTPLEYAYCRMYIMHSTTYSPWYTYSSTVVLLASRSIYFSTLASKYATTRIHIRRVL